MYCQRVPQFRLEPGGFRRHHQSLIRHIHQLIHGRWIHRECHSSIFSIHSIELSKLEFHNYLVGSFDNRPGAASIKLTSIETVHVINEKATFSDNFDECYAAMKENGIQFGISELKYYKLYLTAEEYLRYTQRYLDRPKIQNQGHDEKGTWYIFNCSKFQLDGYFNPFGDEIDIK